MKEGILVAVRLHFWKFGRYCRAFNRVLPNREEKVARTVARYLKTAWLTCLLLALAATAARADTPKAWTVTKSRGTAFVLADQEWRLLSTGDVVVAGQALRTLRSGAIQLKRQDATIELGAGTTAVLAEQAAKTNVDLYSGTLLVNTQSAGPEVSVTAAGVVVTGLQSSLAVRLTSTITVQVAVQSGSAAIVSTSSGQKLVLSPGQSVQTSAVALNGRSGNEVAGTQVTGSEVAANSASSTSVAAAGTGTSAAASGSNNANGNAGGSGANNGNSGSNSNAGGNGASNGNGNGNSGSNGNGNSGNHNGNNK